jgi:[protein-PII] uridylyltransferase
MASQPADAGLRANVRTARERLAAGHQQLRERHAAGCPGGELCAAMTALRDEVLRELYAAALRDLGEDGPAGLGARVALVAHGGYGRCELAPHSDVDVMLLHPPAVVARVAPLADRMVRDVFDAGLTLGHSVRTPDQACQLAGADPQVCTSLLESRLLFGSRRLFDAFVRRVGRLVRSRRGALLAAIDRSRAEERMRYGETVYLLEPHVKRSRGGLRDLQLTRWIGAVRFGEPDWRRLARSGVLWADDVDVLEAAREFLLRLRNELHFHAGKPADVLSRSEQVRLAERLGYGAVAGMLPVEQFMRDYFRHTGGVSHIAGRLLAAARSGGRTARLVTWLFGHRAGEGVRVGPAGLMVTRRGLRAHGGDLGAVLRLADLAARYDVPIEPRTWEAVRREAPRLSAPASPEACRCFLSLLGRPARLGPLLRDLHDAAILERLIPEFAPARGLLQFNQYHKYTVDEHCIRAVEAATELQADTGPLGRVYRALGEKHLLHLALLLHDLGKGHLEDHREVGLAIARRTAERFALPARQRDTLTFLVQKHLLMNHLALRRDAADQDLVVRFAVQVGSPELLRMLYVLTAADLAAVGPGVWDGWKAQIVTDLYHHAMQHLAGDSPATVLDEQVQQRREAIRAWLGGRRDEAWFVRQLDALPLGYLTATPPKRVAADLRALADLPPGGAAVAAQYSAETDSVEVTVGTSESVAPGIFHRLTGALTSLGLEIRLAEIHTFGEGLVLDRFRVRDPDYAGPPPPGRFDEIRRALVDSLRKPGGAAPTFRRLWRRGGATPPAGAAMPSRVLCDNSTSEQYTIIDVFAHDRTGLLYGVAKTLFESGLSVWRARIGTHLDQVVDVFYVTDAEGCKIDDEGRLEEIRRRLLEVIDAPRAEPDRAEEHDEAG